MSTVKISELPLISQINANTANTLFAGVDIPTSATFRMTAKTIAQGLYSNEILNVGSNPVVYPGVSAQFAGNNSTYLQVNLQNFGNTGSSDYVASTSDSDNSTRYIDMGIDGPNYSDPVNYPYFKPYDGYLYVHGPSHNSSSGNLILGTASSNTDITFVAGLTSYQNIIAKITSTGLVLNTQSYITFADGSVQSVAAAPTNYSQAAYAQANVTVGVDTTQNSRITMIEGTDVSQNTRLDYSNAAITIIQGTDVTQNTRLAAIESIDTTQTARITMIEGTDVSQNARMVIIENTNLSQNTRIDYSNAAITIIQATNVTQNTAILATDGKMQSAYNTANNALANTSGTFDGNLTITGNLLTQGTVSLNNSSFNANSPFIKITASNNYTTVAPSNTNYMLQITGKANSVTRVVLDSFGQNSYPVLIGRMGRGSADAPAATQNNDVMMRIVGNGYTGTQFPSSSPTKIDFVAAENITDLARGTQIQFWNTPNGSNTIQRVATLNADSATFLGTVNPTKGFIYTPLVYPSAQTAITIDFANNSMVRAQTSSGIVVSMSNYTVGKIVEVWITNLSGFSQNYTTGVSSINSTLNATTYAIPATSTVCARYFCVDGTLANTLVSVIHA